MKVLVVDDSSVMRSVMRKVLTQSALCIEQLLEAEDGAQGFRLAIQEKPDLIITDINMPKVDGLEMVRLLRKGELTRGIPVIVVSTEGSTDVMSAAEQAGASAYVHKPFTLEVLVEALQNAGFQAMPGSGTGGDF
jgi:two-component system, chemotaxis family, chemotaxis protein CheY